MSNYPRVPFEQSAYDARSRSEGCFICAIVRGEHDLPVHEVFRDNEHVAFLGGYPRLPVLRGKVILSPVQHKEQVVTDFSLEEFLRLQATVYRIGAAVQRVVPTERLYLLSLGSNQGNAHVHWHIAPLPPNVPYDQQQFAALMPERVGLLNIPAEDQAHLAHEIAAAIV